MQDFQELVSQTRDTWPARTKELGKTAAQNFSAELDAAERLGRQLAELRQLRSLTQSEVACRAGLQQADLSRIERGLGNPTRDTLLRLVDALDAELVVRQRA